MFLSKFEKGLLMSPESESSGGGSGGSDNQGSTDNTPNPADKVVNTPTIDVEQIKADLQAQFEARILALESNNKKLLQEKQSLKTEKSQLLEEKLKKEENWKAMYHIETEAKKEAQAEAKAWADKQAEADKAKDEEKLKITRTIQINALKQELGAEFYNEEDAIKDINFEKLIEDKNGKYGVHPEGLKQTANEFREKFHYKLKPVETKVPSTGAKENKVDSRTFGQKASDLGLL